MLCTIRQQCVLCSPPCFQTQLLIEMQSPTRTEALITRAGQARAAVAAPSKPTILYSKQQAQKVFFFPFVHSWLSLRKTSFQLSSTMLLGATCCRHYSQFWYAHSFLQDSEGWEWAASLGAAKFSGREEWSTEYCGFLPAIHFKRPPLAAGLANTTCPCRGPQEMGLPTKFSINKPKPTKASDIMKEV